MREQAKASIISFLVTLIIGILCINLVSSLTTIEPIATANKYPDLIIKDNGIQTSKFILEYNTENCFINCEARINFTTTTDNTIPTLFDFMDSKSKLKTLSYQVYYANSITNEAYTSKHYNRTCTGTGNLTICNDINDYNYTEYRKVYDWKLYDGKPVKAGNHIFRLTASKNLRDNIEWSFSFGNITSDTIRNYWASWNDGYSTGLIGYWSFNETTGANIPNIVNSSMNGTSVNSPLWLTGKSGNGLNFSAGSSQYAYVTTTQMFNWTNKNYTISWWYKANKNTQGRIIAREGSAQDWYCQYEAGSTRLECAVTPSKIFYSTNTIAVGNWYHFVISYNTNGTILVYTNGTQGVAINSVTPVFTSIASANLTFSRRDYPSSPTYSDMMIDEVAIWTRYLSPSEITDLYNAGTGLFYSDIPADPTPKVSFINKTPSDINSFNLINQVLKVNYTIITYLTLNTSQTNIFVKTNSTTSNNLIFINGTTYSNLATGYNLVSHIPSNISTTYTFSVDENEVYPATYNINADTMINQPHNITDTGINGGVLIGFYNVSNTTAYNFIEIMANRTGTGNPLITYYCNSTYTTGSVPSSSNCENIGSLNANATFNHTDGTYSQHQLIPFTIINGTIGNVKVTQTSSFVFGGNQWQIYYIVNNSRTGNSKTSNNLITWTNLAGTIDSHVHQYNLNDTFWFYACANNTNGNTNCTTPLSDNLDLIVLPPTTPFITNPTGATYSGDINITYLASVSTTGINVSYYGISLFYSNFTFIENITDNNGLSLSYLWNSSVLNDSDYRIGVIAVNINDIPSSYGYSEIFTLNNQQITPATRGIFYLDFTNLRGVVIFVIILVVAILILLFVNWSLGCLFIVLAGIIALVNEQNILIGVMITIAGIVLIFTKEK